MAKGTYALILGAGKGERIGGPKALLEIDGTTLAERHVLRARSLSCTRIVLVVRPEVAARLDTTACPELILALSEAPDPAGSLAVGLRALADVDPDACALVTPVDALPASQETCTILLGALDGAWAATPVCEGRGGHPVACRLAVLEPYRVASSPPPLRNVLSALGPRRVRIEVNDPAVVVDLDTTDDLRALTGQTPRFASQVVFREAHICV